MLGPHQPIGRLLRLPLKAIPPATALPILSGPNRGMKWIVGSSIQRCWFGRYEPVLARLMAAKARPGMTVFDVGAHVGYYTLMLSRIVGPSGRVFAFEPNPENLKNLKSHIRLNGIRNVTVVEAAVTDKVGEARFSGTDSIGHIDEIGEVVKTVRLDDYPIPDLIKMDIEGAEVMALSGAANMLAQHRTSIFLAVHEGEPFEKVPIQLEAAHYSVEWFTDDQLLALPIVP